MTPLPLTPPRLERRTTPSNSKSGQGRCTFLDSVRLRGESFENIDRQQLAIVRGLADTIDNSDFDTLHGGAGQTQATATSAPLRLTKRLTS